MATIRSLNSAHLSVSGGIRRARCCASVYASGLPKRRVHFSTLNRLPSILLADARWQIAYYRSCSPAMRTLERNAPARRSTLAPNARASPELPNGALGAALCASEFEALTDLAARIRSAGWQSPTPRLFTLELTP